MDTTTGEGPFGFEDDVQNSTKPHSSSMTAQSKSFLDRADEVMTLIVQKTFALLLLGMILGVVLVIVTIFLVLLYSAGTAIGTSTQTWLGLLLSLLFIAAGIGVLADDDLVDELWLRVVAIIVIMLGSAAFMGTVSASNWLSHFATSVLSFFVR